MRLCLLCPGPGPRLSSPSWARLAMLMWRADLRKIGQTDSRWGAEAQKHLGEGVRTCWMMDTHRTNHL